MLNDVGEMLFTDQAKSEGNYSAVIIGGGLGGLAAGAKLARAGQKILLIEQNTDIGGCARVVQDENFVHEFSLHQLCGFEKGNDIGGVYDLPEDIGFLGYLNTKLPEKNRKEQMDHFRDQAKELMEIRTSF